MAKTSKLSKIFVVLLFVVVAAALSFAFVNVPIGVARAEEPYPDCTAVYRVVEDQNNFYWDSSYWRVHSTEGSVKKMVLQIEGEGAFVIGWGTNRAYKKASNEPMLSVYRYTDSSQKGEALSSVQGNGSTSQSSAMECRIEHVDIDDYIEIVFTEACKDTNSYALLWMNPPTNTVNLSASVADDSQGKGFIKSDSSTEHPGENVQSDTYTIRWTAPFSVTAIAEEGNYFAYWTNKEGEILSRAETYTVKNVLAKNEGDQYYAHFVSSDYTSIQSSKKEDKPFWSATDEKWSLDFSNYSPADKDVASLTYDFVAQEGQFVSFDYFQSCNSFTAIFQKYSYPIFKLYLNGTELRKFVPYNAAHDETDAIGNFAVPVTKTGFNQLEFRFNVSYSYRNLWQYEEGDQVYVKNIKVCNEEEVQTTQFVFTFESEWLKVTCTDVAKNETKEISSGEPVDLSNGTMWQISSSTKSSKKSSEFDSSVQVNYSRTGVWTAEAGEISPYFVPQGNALAMKGSNFSSSNNSVKTLRLNGTTEIETGYKEEVPLAVSATKTTDNEDTIIDIPNGTIIDFPFGKNNTMVVRIDTYSQFDAENYAITLDGQIYSGRIEAMDEFLAFVLTDVKNHIVSIKYNLPDDGKYIYSRTRVEFMVKEGVEGGIENIVKTPDSLNVEDIKSWGGKDTWLFDPELSMEGNYVYQASNSFDWIDESVNPGQEGLSTFTLSMKDTVAEGTGSISFEFQISGGYYAQQGQQLLGAYLCYREGAAVTENDFNNMMGGKEQPEYLKDLAKSSTGGAILTGNGVAKAGDWYRANIIIQKGETIYVSFFSYNVKPYGDQIDTYLNIRNIRLNVGNTNVTVQRGADAKGTVTSAIGEQRNENKTESVSYDVAIGSTLELSATLGDGEEFYGWSVNGALVSTEPTASLFVEGQMNVVAWMAPANFYTARAEGQFFKTIEEAVNGAENGTVYVIQDTTIRESLTIPSGVTMLIPYNDANGFMEAGKEGTAENKISWLNPKYQDAYRTVTVAEGCKITVEGTLRVGAVVNYLKGQGYQGHTSGAYAELILKNGSSIQVASGGVMDVYGRVWGGEDAKESGMGTIDVAEGGKLYEPFLILDFMGGTETFGLFMNGVTPFKRYAMINIECPMTVHYGGMLYGHASLWVETMTLHASLDQPFISYDMGNEKGGDGQGADTFVMLHKKSSVKITYNPDKIVNNASAVNCTEGIGQTTMIFEGGATFSYMKFSAMGMSVPTCVVTFSIPYNFNVELNGNEAQYETVTDFMLMPGATVTVGEGATLTLSANTWIFDGLVQPVLANKSYPTAADLKNAGYSQSGNLIVNGNLKISKKKPIKVTVTIAEGPDDDAPVPAIFVGIVQTTSNTGTIVIDSQAILTFRPFDGTEGSSGGNYFAYSSTARVWDAAHGCFADLEAGKTYTAVKDKEGNDVTFALDSIKYTNKKDGEDTLTLTLNQQMHGSWMEVHEGHNLDWTPDPEKDALTGNNTVISRQCSVMGCNHTEEKYLLKDASAFETQIYKGSAYSADDLRALFLKMFGLQEGGLLEGFDVKFQFKPLDGGLQNIEGQLLNVPSSAYQIAVTLTNGVWLVDGAYVGERTFTFDIDPYELTGLTDDITVDEAQQGKLPSKTYTGSRLTYEGLTVKFKGQTLTATVDYTIQNGNNLNVAEGGTVTIAGVKNFSGSFELKFDITPVDISGGKLSVQNTAFVYNGQAQTPSREQLIIQGVARFDNNVITVDINASGNIDAGTASVTVTGTGNFAGTTQAAEYQIARKNIEITLAAQSTIYSGEAQNPHSIEGDWSFDEGAICSRDGVKDELNIQIKLAHGDAIDAADYDLTFTFENSNYNVTRKVGDSAKFTIEQKSIAGAKVEIAEGKTYSFNGGNITPAVEDVNVTLDGWDKPITFSVSATDNLNKGTAHFTVSGTGNYTGTSEQGEFEIKAASVTIKVNDLSSALGDDLKTNYGYSVSAGRFFGEDETTFRNNISGKYACTADNTHISDAQHQYKITLDVAQAQAALQNYDITVIDGVYTVNDSVFKDVAFEAQNVPYDGKGHTLAATNTPDGAVIKYEYQAGEAPEDDAWQAIPDGGLVNAGKYSIRVTITLAEHESKYQEIRLLTINPKNISDATVTVNGKYTYTGSAITVEKTNITVTLADWSLQIDFEIVADGYSNNTEATSDTKATVKIKGTGNYTGEATGEFDIAKKSIAGGTLTVSGTYTYNGKAQMPQGDALSVTLEGFGKVTFQVKAEGGYDNNVNATTLSSKAKVTVEGTGNFEGELSAFFEIGQAQVDKVEVQNANGYVYNGSDIEPQLVVKSGEIALNAGDYDIEYTTVDNSHKNAGTVTFKVAGKGNFKGEVSSSFTIKAKKITVRLLKQTTVFTGVTPIVSSEQNVGWEVDKDAICGDDDLNIRLSAEGLTAAAKTYTVKPEFSNPNYEVEWDPETAEFEITPATITITVEDAYSTYGDSRAALNKRVDGICEIDSSTLNIDDYVTLSCDVNERTGYGTYDITCTKKGADPANYTIQIANTGTYTVNKRDVTVNITDQNDTYNAAKNYRWNANAWEVDENTPLVNGDERTALNVQLARPALGNAGTYVITATYESDNYNVTFKGSWNGEDANKEKAGTYTIAKKRVTDNGEDVTFMISVGGDDWTHEDNLSVKYSGAPITLDAQVYVMESGDSSLAYTIDPAELTEVKIYTVTVTINDDNYEGSRTFTVEVLTAEGYSQALNAALDDLEGIVGELTYDALTSSEEHFGIVKQVKAILDALSEEDKEAGAEQLARYEKLVETWQNAADLDDDVIETAKDIADSPIKWLFALAEMSALLAALYVVGKGGLR